MSYRLIIALTGLCILSVLCTFSVLSQPSIKSPWGLYSPQKSFLGTPFCAKYKCKEQKISKTNSVITTTYSLMRIPFLGKSWVVVDSQILLGSSNYLATKVDLRVSDDVRTDQKIVVNTDFKTYISPDYQQLMSDLSLEIIGKQYKNKIYAQCLGQLTSGMPGVSFSEIIPAPKNSILFKPLELAKNGELNSFGISAWCESEFPSNRETVMRFELQWNVKKIPAQIPWSFYPQPEPFSTTSFCKKYKCSPGKTKNLDENTLDESFGFADPKYTNLFKVITLKTRYLPNQAYWVESIQLWIDPQIRYSNLTVNVSRNFIDLDTFTIIYDFLYEILGKKYQKQQVISCLLAGKNSVDDYYLDEFLKFPPTAPITKVSSGQGVPLYLKVFCDRTNESTLSIELSP